MRLRRECKGCCRPRGVASAAFAKAYYGETPASGNVLEAVSCFRALFRELRAQM